MKGSRNPKALRIRLIHPPYCHLFALVLLQDPSVRGSAMVDSDPKSGTSFCIDLRDYYAGPAQINFVDIGDDVLSRSRTHPKPEIGKLL